MSRNLILKWASLFSLIFIMACSSSKNAYNLEEGDRFPIYPGCEKSVDPRKCFATSLSKFVSKHFDRGIVSREAFNKDKARIVAVFTVTTEGKIADLQIHSPNTAMYLETTRIFALLPKIEPGMFEGELTDVNFSLPITID